MRCNSASLLVLFAVCAFWMIFGGNKYPDGSAGNPNRTEVSVGGFEHFNEAMFSMWRLTLVDEYAYEVSSIFFFT